MTDKEREELAEAIGKGLASGSKISAEDLQNENTISYKMGEIMEMDADFVTLLNFVDWYSPTKEVNEKLTKMLRHIAGQTYQNQTKVVDLEKENAELKTKVTALENANRAMVKELDDTTSGGLNILQNVVKNKEELTKAKEIIKDLLNLPFASNEEVFADVGSHLYKAEQFLSEVEK